MISRRPRKRPASALPWVLTLVALGLLAASCGEEAKQPPATTDDGSPDGDCVPTLTFFNEHVWTPVMSTTCIACHNPQGAARDSRLVLIDANQPGYLEANLAVLEDVAGLERNGVSILLIKPTGGDNHGGGPQITEDSEAYASLAALVDRFKNPVACEDQTEAVDFDDVVLMDPQQTLRKATIVLGGRLPTADETDRVLAGGEEALGELLDELMKEEAFYTWLKELYNDQFLTNRYLGRNNAIDLLNDEDYPDRYWHQDESMSEEERTVAQRFTNNSVAADTLELVAHVVREDRPFTEILTADYTMVNPYSARVFGVFDQVSWTDRNDANEWHEARIPGHPHAGVLTSPMWLNRFPTTDTNVNRHRSRMVFRFFLATDILRLASRPVDPSAVAGHNPTLNDANCSVCHAVMDPVAGTFMNWTASGRYLPPEEGWYPDLRSPGFGDTTLPWDERFEALAWLADQIAADRRFVTSSVQILFQGLTGQKPVLTPTDRNAPDYAIQLEQSENQERIFNEIGDAMVADGYNLKTAIKGIILSPYFRAINATSRDEERAAQLANVGAARFLPPELLNRKIVAVLGYPWEEGYDRRRALISDRDYLIFYGGIDSDSVTERITDPNGMMANIAERMSNHMACVAVPRDFTLPMAERRLFRNVETTYEPEDVNGFEIEDSIAAIKANIQYLHEYLLGERLAVTDAEIERTYGLFLETYREGKIGMAQAGYSDRLPDTCRVRNDFTTGTELPEAQRLEYDRNYVVRAWMAVVSYMLSDFRFLHE